MANTEQHDPDLEDPFESLSQAQLIAIEHIANGATHTLAAEEAGVCRETISRWKRVPMFEAELKRLRMRGLHRIDTTDIGPEDPDTILDEEVDAHEQAVLEEDRKLAVQRSFDRLGPSR